MMTEMFLWWLLYAVVLFFSLGLLSSSFDSDPWVVVFMMVPFNGLYFSALYNNFYLKWFFEG